MKRFLFWSAKQRRKAEPAAPDAAISSQHAVHPNGDSAVGSPRGSLIPGSDGEHRLQSEYGSTDRAHAFYARQVLDYLSPTMQEFIARQEILFVSTADRHGECDCTSKFGRPGFIRVLSDKYLMYPEYRGNGVFANLGNITENPHIGMLILDLYRDTVGLHVNGKARIVANDDLLQYQGDLPDNVIDEIHLEGKKKPERWVMVEVQEAYIQCSKHIPLMKKLDKRIEWGTDDVAAKGGDFFRLMQLPLYDRLGGDKVVEKLADLFAEKLRADQRVARFFEDADRTAQRLQQKSFLGMALGGPYAPTGDDLQAIQQRMVDRGLTAADFDRVLTHFRDTVHDLHLPDPEVDKMCDLLNGFRDQVLSRRRTADTA